MDRKTNSGGGFTVPINANQSAQTIHLIAVDLDGTLLTSQRTLPPEGIRLIRELITHNVHVVLATTRSAAHTRAFCHKLGIDSPMICSNGAQVWASPAGPLWREAVIPKQTALVIAEWADRHEWELCITVGDMTYFRQRPGQALGPLAPNATVVPTNQAAVQGDATRILTHHPDAIESINTLCQSRFVDHCRTEFFYEPDGRIYSFGVFPAGADKGTALNEVLNRLGIAVENVLAIGDNSCDLPMFAVAGTSVAMDNASSETKAAATVVAPSNDEEGVAWAIQQFVLPHL